MRRRLCLLIPSLDRGGAEKQLCLLATGLPQDLFDVHVLVLTREGPLRSNLEQAGVPVTLIGKRFQADPTAYFRLTKLFRSLRPDIVHTWIFAANSFGRAAAKAAGVRCIIGSERCVDLWKTNRHLWIDRYLARSSAAITTNSTGVQTFYASQGIDAHLFHVIPNGIPDSQADPIDRHEASRRLRIDPTKRWIAAVGRLWPQKRYRDLIWGAELLGEMRGDTTLVVIGDGPQKAELQRYRDCLSTVDRIRFVGAREDVSQLLPHFDTFWIGSAYEGQSNSVMEAMRAARPVVATDIPGNRDLVDHGKTGLLVPLGDSAAFARETNHLLENPSEGEALGAAARQRILDQFSVSKMIQRHVDLYRQLMDQGKPSANSISN